MASSNRKIYSLIFILGLLTIWGFITALALIDPIILPAPWNVAQAIPKMLGEDGLLKDIGFTIGRVAVALAIACCMGIPLGLFLGYRKDIYSIFEGPLHALRSVPATALFPLLLIVIGVGESSIIALATYPSLLVILVNSVAGASLANRRRLHQATMLGVHSVTLIREVLFYEALPNIFDGVRTAVSYSLVLVVAVEMFIGVGNVGLGRKIYDYQSSYLIPETYAAIIITGGVGIILNLLLSYVERHLLRWVPETQHEY
jgi:ABC-type nitrate/sulfonate/bicarbonate transport system permease component